MDCNNYEDKIISFIENELSDKERASKNAKVSRYLIFGPTSYFPIGFNACLSSYSLDLSLNPYGVLETSTRPDQVMVYPYVLQLS